MALTRIADKQLASSSADETEPAVLTYRHFGVDYSCSVWMNFSPNIQASSKLYVTSWTSTGNSNTSAIPLLEADPTGTLYRYADPVLVKDPTQNRIFLIALAIKTVNSTTKIYSVLAWASTNGGWNWSLTPQVVAQAKAIQFGSPNIRLDKPVATVGPDGKLWVSWVRQTTDLRMRTATVNASGWTWSPALNQVIETPVDDPYDDPGILISAGVNQPRTNGHNPQIMGDLNSVAYILFTDYDAIGSNNWGRIGLIKYDANATPQFVSLANATNNTSVPTLYTGKSSDDWLALTGSVTLRAGTVPSAKLDRTRGRISVTWHERNGTGHSRVQFASYKIATGTWITTTLATNGHNVLPAMDFDPANGNFMVTWYAIGHLASTYSHAGSYVTFSGDTPIAGTQDTITNQVGADMAYLTPLSAGSADRIVGDYHEVSFTNGSFKAAHIHATSAGSNPWSFTVAP